MSINSIAQTGTAQVASQSAATNTNTPPQSGAKESAPAKTKPAATDTVTISSQAKLAAQEATETAAQTAKEARSGDLQAKKLLAKQTAAEELKEPAYVKAQEAKGIAE
jgi:hypothetical protein